jgi:hypothetical protein
MARTDVVAVAVLAAFTAALSAFEPALDPRSLADAIELGQSRIDDVRSRFHAAYHIEVMQPPVDYVEVGDTVQTASRLTPKRALEQESGCTASARRLRRSATTPLALTSSSSSPSTLSTTTWVFRRSP